MPSASQPIRYYRYNASNWETVNASIISESLVTLTVNGEAWLNFACTPADLDALAVGFLFNEGIIQDSKEIVLVEVCHQGTNVDVWLRQSVQRPTEWQRTSGCMGGVTAANQHRPDSMIPVANTIAPRRLLEGMEQLLQSQDLYHETGGVHCSALFDGDEIRIRAEDIGRHNTLDKLAGKLLLSGLRMRPVILLTTGRVSSDMLQKSARLEAEIVVSRTSPTSQSVTMAGLLGITLIGYARRNGFQVYTYPERLAGFQQG